MRNNKWTIEFKRLGKESDATSSIDFPLYVLVSLVMAKFSLNLNVANWQSIRSIDYQIINFIIIIIVIVKRTNNL